MIISTEISQFLLPKGNGATFRSSPTTEATFDFSNGAHGQSDLFASSKWIADKFVTSNSVYDLNPKAKIDPKGSNHEANFNQVDEVAEIEENDWDFRCASSETGSSAQVLHHLYESNDCGIHEIFGGFLYLFHLPCMFENQNYL